MNCTPFVIQYGILNNKWSFNYAPKRISNKRYTLEFKVLETLLEEGLSYSETERQFDLLNKRQAAWKQIYLEDVPEGFTIECRGHSRTKRSGKLPTAVKENLLAEIQ